MQHPRCCVCSYQQDALMTVETEASSSPKTLRGARRWPFLFSTVASTNSDVRTKKRDPPGGGSGLGLGSLFPPLRLSDSLQYRLFPQP